ncbi:class I SAM-dependent methyltransferase, partial [bacterium]|nr:class I SAM-dependent methyltransferase [bacterium]
VGRLKRRSEKEGITNLEVRVADVYDLPFADGAFDLIYMITVIGEIPEPVRAMREFRRVLVPGGKLALTERILDPDYPLTKTLIGWAEQAGFGFVKRTGNLIRYTLFFEKPDMSGPECG